MEKPCSKCKNIKPYSEFYKDKSRSDGHCNYCKICDKKRLRNKEKADERHKKWRNSEAGKKYFQKYYKERKEEYAERNKKWAEENRERLRELYRNSTKSERWRKKHKERMAHRRALKLKATLTDFRDEIKKIYENCPSGHHVDHIIPLVNPNICGLHVPWNLQYLPAEENLRKNNKLIKEATYVGQ